MYPHHDIFKGASGICFEEEEEDFNWTYNGQFLYKICELWFTAGLGSQRRLSHHKKKYFSFLTWWGFFPFWVTEQHDRFFFFFHCRISSWEQQNCLLCRSLRKQPRRPFYENPPQSHVTPRPCDASALFPWLSFPLTIQQCRISPPLAAAGLLRERYDGSRLHSDVL